MALLDQNFGEQNCKNPFPASLIQKNTITPKPRGGTKGLSGRTTKKRTFFCDFPYLLFQKHINQQLYFRVTFNFIK